MLRIKSLSTLVFGVLTAALLTTSHAQADCKILQLAELHVDPEWRSPVVDAQINGQPAKVMFDTGSNTTILYRGEAVARGLDVDRVDGLEFYGVGGATQGYIAAVKSLTLGPFSVSNISVLVVGRANERSKLTALLGNDVLSKFDIEFDLPDGVVRILKPQGCLPDQLAYWAKTYAQADILPVSRDHPIIQSRVMLNGRSLLAELDSGAATSLVDASSARDVGVKDETAHDIAVRGVGDERREAWSGVFSSFAYGDEQIAHVRLDILPMAPDMKEAELGSHIPTSVSGDSISAMLIGADFLHSHRVLVANKEKVVVFTYSGGPVFQSSVPAPHAAKAPPPTGQGKPSAP